MNETEALRALMLADRWIDRVTSQKTHLPESAELTALESELRALLGNLHDAEGALSPLQSAYEVRARESTRLRRRASDLDATLAASTASARELTALQSEVAHVRQLLGESEDLELALLLDLEPREAEVASIKQRAQPGVARRVELLDTIVQLRTSLDEELVSLRIARERCAEAVAAPVRARYDVALARVGASGAAQVVEGRCDGCRLALAPLDVDRFKAQLPDTFMDCPECGRLLLP